MGQILLLTNKIVRMKNRIGLLGILLLTILTCWGQNPSSKNIGNLKFNEEELKVETCEVNQGEGFDVCISTNCSVLTILVMPTANQTVNINMEFFDDKDKLMYKIERKTNENLEPLYFVVPTHFDHKFRLKVTGKLKNDTIQLITENCDKIDEISVISKIENRSGDSLNENSALTQRKDTYELQMFKVYPIPTMNNLSIESNFSNEDEYRFYFFNTFGQLLFSNDFSTNTTLDLSSLAAGSYVLKITSPKGNFVETHQIIKMSQ